MADIELVIKIDEEKYDVIKSDLYDTFPVEMKKWGLEAIRHSTPLLNVHKWIPVDDRLPKDDEDVLVCNSQGAMEVCYYHIDDTFYPTEYADLNETGWYDENDDMLYLEPIAWMPLPTPYKAESEE